MGCLKSLRILLHQHGILHLDAVDPGHLLGSLPLLDGVVGNADKADLAGLPDIRHGLDGLLFRHVFRRPVEQVNVDVIGLQVRQGLVDLVHDLGAGRITDVLSVD